MERQFSRLVKRHPLGAFFALAYGVTWLGSSLYVLATTSGRSSLPNLPAVLGGILWYYGPCLAALLVTRLGEGVHGVRHLLRGLLTRPQGWRWLAFVVLYPLAMRGVVFGLDWLLGGTAPVFLQAEGVPENNPWVTLLGLLALHVLIRGIGEETGWRGFALGHLLPRYGAFSASLILGALWAIWHFHPANFPTLLAPAGIAISLNIVATSVIYTWLYNYTRGSLLTAVLFHASLNVAEWIMPIGISNPSAAGRAVLQVSVVWAFALGLRFVCGPQLQRRADLTPGEPHVPQR